MRRADRPLDAERQWLSEGFLQAVELLTPARYFLDKTEIEDPETRRTKFREWYEDFNPETDRKVAKRMLALAREHMKRLPDCYAVIDRDFGGDIDAYVDWVYDRSRFTSIEGVEALLDDFSHEKAEADPAMPLARAVWERYTELGEQRKPLAEKFDEGHRLYIAGLMRMQPDKAWASDANSTIRLTYGQVLPYDPVDGVHYNYWTTLRGVMEKENPENREFVVPARLKGALCRRRLRPLCRRGRHAPRGFPCQLRHHGRQLRFPDDERARRADRPGFRRQLGGHVGRRGVRARVAAHDRGGCPLRALRDRQVRGCRLAARRNGARAAAPQKGRR